MMKSVKLGIMALYFLLIFSVVVFASTECPTKEEYRVMIKEATKDYLTSPTHEKLMQLQDMYKIYATHDFTKCLEEETKPSGTKGRVQTCSDRTPYGKCSAIKPKYCEAGNLIDKCKVCSCPTGFKCEDNGRCVVLTCSDGTRYNYCSTTKPLFCQDGALVNKCGICGCYEDHACKADESCVDKTEAKQVLPLIMEAEKLLAQKALETAENTPVKYPEKYEQKVKQEIETAKQSLAQANIEAENGEYDKAINDYENSWEHSQKAIEYANKEKQKKK